MPLKWEFPGGKVDGGETDEVCLIREIQEELGVTVAITGRLTPSLYHYEHRSVLLIPFLCMLAPGAEPLPKVHACIEWAERSQLPFYNWTEADIPIMNQLLEE